MKYYYCNIQDGARCDKAFYLGCCSSPRLASDLSAITDDNEFSNSLVPLEIEHQDTRST